MAGRSHRREDAQRLPQQARAVTRVAEAHDEARSFLDHKRELGARTGLDDQHLGARQARLDAGPRRRTVERAQHPRLREVCAGLIGAAHASQNFAASRLSWVQDGQSIGPTIGCSSADDFHAIRREVRIDRDYRHTKPECGGDDDQHHAPLLGGRTLNQPARDAEELALACLGMSIAVRAATPPGTPQPEAPRHRRVGHDGPSYRRGSCASGAWCDRRAMPGP